MFYYIITQDGKQYVISFSLTPIIRSYIEETEETIISVHRAFELIKNHPTVKTIDGWIIDTKFIMALKRKES